MKLKAKCITACCLVFGGAVGAICITHPQKTAESTQSLEAVGAVAVDQVISSLEARVGKTAVALEHYKTVQKAKRESLVSLKTIKADCDRKAAECRTAIEKLEKQGNDDAVAIKRTELATYETQGVSMAASVERAEKSYKEFNQFMVNKKIELEALRSKTEMLKGELLALNGADAGYAMKRARELEDEVKTTCSRLESEMQVQKMDEDAAN